MSWISINDRLPDNANNVLLYGTSVCGCCNYQGPSLFVGFYEKELQCFRSEYEHWLCEINVLYWMPIPKLLKK